MKKIYQAIGLISLLCFSFFLTEQTAIVIKNMDDIMISINDNKDNYTKNSIDAIIKADTIIPGICERNVNVSKSYKLMKNSGYYSDKLFVYNYKLPNVSISDNKDKYIIKGNKEKRYIGLTFLVKDNTNINNILKIVNNYNIKVTFFVNYNWFINNTKLVSSIIEQGHNIGMIYTNYNDIEWMNIIIKRINNQVNGFCYNKDKNIDYLKQCIEYENYSIIPIEITSTNPLYDIKQNIESGNIYIFNINRKLEYELSTIIITIKSKGYEMTNMEQLIDEKY